MRTLPQEIGRFEPPTGDPVIQRAPADPDQARNRRLRQSLLQVVT